MWSFVAFGLVVALSLSGATSATAAPAPHFATAKALPVAAVAARGPATSTPRFVSTESGQVRSTRDGSGTEPVQTAEGDRAPVEFLAAVGRYSFDATFLSAYPPVLTASTSFATFQPVATASSTLPLSQGAYGSLVAEAQRMLVQVGILLPLTGTYDAATVAAITRFQGKFSLPATGQVDVGTWQTLSTLAKSDALPSQCVTKGTVICVDMELRILRLVINGKVISGLDARFGSPVHITREGTFRVYKRFVTHTSSDYGTSMPYALFFSGAEAIHFSDAFQTEGYKAYSHGCVNLRDMGGAKALFAKAPLGTKVFVYRG